MTVGAFTFVLHSHLPYARKAGVWPFGEEWVFEALAETYLPVLNILHDFQMDSVPIRMTISLTPVLMEQLADPYMVDRFEEYVENRIRLASEDWDSFQTSGDYEYAALAEYYRRFYERTLSNFRHRYDRDVLAGFRRFQDAGLIEVITCAATHGYLPLMATDSSINAQIRTGCDTYRKHLRCQPTGIWLPECAYRPAVAQTGDANTPPGSKPAIDYFLSENGLRYFIADTHAIQGGKAFGLYTSAHRPVEEMYPRTGKTTFLPYLLNNSPVAVFGRNERTGLQVWSGEWGYPADGNYREFHKKHHHSGMQYWRVTGRNADLGSKERYDPETAFGCVGPQSDHFVSLVRDMLVDFHEKSGEYGIVVAPYDIELFGHWWFEGVQWLRSVLAKMQLSADIDLVTTREYLQNHPPKQQIELPESSWGLGGKHYVWMNPETEWMWPKIHRAEQRMELLANQRPDESGTMRRVLNQAARELLLLESSDWPFLLTTGQAKEYTVQRFEEHLSRFHQLAEMAENGNTDAPAYGQLVEWENRDTLFHDLDYGMYGRQVH